ncbi:MAG: hypothetical protein ABSC64_20055 [Candidatus Korobacteraceae bacterium]
MGEKHASELLRANMRDVETVAHHLLESRSLTRDVLNIRLTDAHRLEGIMPPFLDTAPSNWLVALNEFARRRISSTSARRGQASAASPQPKGQ